MRVWRVGRWAAAWVAGAAMVVQGCSKPQAQQAPPPAEVAFSLPLQHEVVEWDEYTGHLEAPEVVNLEARVSGFIVAAPFQEGALVHKDDLLFVIDDRPFKADLDSKMADVAKAQSQADQAKVHLDRYTKVRGTQAISEDDYDSAKASYEQALAALAGAKAAQETDQLNLGWTRVTAPITGRISRKAVTLGNLVTSGGGMAPGTLLTTIVSVDPIYCYVAVPERSFLKYHSLAGGNKTSGDPEAGMHCFIQLANETSFPHEGVVDFLDNSVDPATGTIQLRAVVPNPQGSLRPGLFARMRLPASGQHEALLIPDVAIGTDQNERFVLVVGGGDVVEVRPVTLGPLFGTLRSITQGLKPGEKVIVDGLQMARPGAKVNPHESPIQTAGLDLTGPEIPTTQGSPASEPASEPGKEAHP